VGIFGHLHGHFPWDDNHGSGCQSEFHRIKVYVLSVQFTI
jgi:hypothetical protein